MGRFNFKQHTEDNYEVSPSQAKKWLEQNKANRSVNKAKVKQMARDIKEGHWDSTHQGVDGAFPYDIPDKDGKMIYRKGKLQTQ